jgi:Ca-activated chloride channel family protein
MKCNRSMRAAVVVLAGVLAAPIAQAGQVDLKVAVSHPVVVAGQKQTAYLKISLVGLPFTGARERAPVNVGFVVDRSGSMAGQKLERAKQAAITAIARLDRNDIVSVVAYDDTLQVLVPATRARDKEEIYRAIRALRPGNSTALFAGVSRGAAEVRKFLEANQVNRVILLSDGLANVGPSSPEALFSLGAALAKEGISVTTLGLGLDYNEDLMVGLARASDGNHAFVESAADLPRIFGLEFGDLLSAVAKDVHVIIRCGDDVRPIRVLGRDAEIVGQTVITTLKQIYGKQEKYVLLEVELPARLPGSTLPLASAEVEYLDLASQARAKLEAAKEIKYTGWQPEAEKAIDREVMVAAVEQIANENSKRALALRDQGQIDQARDALLVNERYLDDNAAKFNSERLKSIRSRNRDNADNLEPNNWNRQRKAMQKEHYEFDSQQAW